MTKTKYSNDNIVKRINKTNKQKTQNKTNKKRKNKTA